MASQKTSNSEWLGQSLGKLRSWAEHNPGAAVLASNAATVSIFLYLKAQEEGGVVPFMKSVFKGALEGAVQAAAGGSVEAEIRSTAAKIEEKVLGDDRSKRSLVTLPDKGLSKEQLLIDLQMMAARVSAGFQLCTGQTISRHEPVKLRNSSCHPGIELLFQCVSITTKLRCDHDSNMT